MLVSLNINMRKDSIEIEGGCAFSIAPSQREVNLKIALVSYVFFSLGEQKIKKGSFPI